MKKTAFLVGLLTSLKLISGHFLPENLKFCVFAGDFDIVTLAGEIKKRSEKMTFSVVVNFERLSDVLAIDDLQSKTTIVISQKISAPDQFMAKVKIKNRYLNM